MPSADDDLGIGSRVRAARQRRGWSREALAFHAGISWSAITQLEAGRRRNLRPSTVAALAGALGVTVDYLVSGSDTTAEMLEHGSLIFENDDEFLAASVPFLTAAVDRSETALAVTTAHHCDLLRSHLGSVSRHVEFADQASWCDTPGNALTRLRAFVDGHLAAGAHWLRILVERAPLGRSVADAEVWGRYESLLNLVFASTPLTVVCAYETSTLEPELVDHVLPTHPHTLAESAELVANSGYLDPVEFVLAAADADAAPPTGVNR